MKDRFPPLAPTFPHMLHGGDYNPEQWIRTPEVWDEDIRLAKLAGANTFSVGIFSWAMLEPREGHFTFDWLDRVADLLAKNDIRMILATPGGAKPTWMAKLYPQTLRVDAHRRRQLWGGRHNHCFTSPAYRSLAQTINLKLAQRYKDHPTLTLWHVNNEYSGDCHCDLCQAAFREWLRKKYDNDLDKLNRAWWSTFWSHTISDWTEIQSPSPIGESHVHGLNLDWKRFATDQTIECFRAEAEPLRRITPKVPVTTNYMGVFSGLDYYKFAKELDVITWDSYPSYHDRPDDWKGAAVVSFIHSQRRSMLQKPFILMESAPGQQNYKPVCKQKRPGVHLLEGLQTIAHGSDSVLYFQWRKSRGSVEKFHGAVVDHFATEHNRIFREVSDLGAALGRMDDVVGTDSKCDVAFIFDYQNKWAFDDAAGPRNQNKDVIGLTCEHYRAFWHAGVNCDVIGQDEDFSKYKLIVAPLMYMVRAGVAERIEKFVKAGGTFVTTYFSGVVDDTDLCFLTGFPGPLRKLLGIWAEETDALYDDEKVLVEATQGNAGGLKGQYEGGYLADVIQLEGATALANYASEFYAGTPAVTVNSVGAGKAYYLATRLSDAFHRDFYTQLIDDLKLRRALPAQKSLPQGVTAAVRNDGQREFVFVMNFNRDTQKIDLGPVEMSDLLTGEKLCGPIDLGGYKGRVLVHMAV